MLKGQFRSGLCPTHNLLVQIGWRFSKLAIDWWRSLVKLVGSSSNGSRYRSKSGRRTCRWNSCESGRNMVVSNEIWPRNSSNGKERWAFGGRIGQVGWNQVLMKQRVRIEFWMSETATDQSNDFWIKLVGLGGWVRSMDGLDSPS